MVQKNINIQNKKARFEFEILDKFVAGIQLTGTEIKSIRLSQARITESFCEFNERGELFIVNMYIQEYLFGHHFNHKPKSERRLLLNKRELRSLKKDVEAKGKQTHDKREVIKDRDNKRDLARIKKNF